MSKLGVDLTIAFRSLVQHRRRTLFLGTAIAAVTTLLVLLNGLTTGVRETMIDTATTLSTGHVNVGGFFKVTAGQAAGRFQAADTAVLSAFHVDGSGHDTMRLTFSAAPEDQIAEGVRRLAAALALPAVVKT